MKNNVLSEGTNTQNEARKGWFTRVQAFDVPCYYLIRRTQKANFSKVMG